MIDIPDLLALLKAIVFFGKKVNCMLLLGIGWHQFSEQVLWSDSCFSHLLGRQSSEIEVDLKTAIYIV